VAVVAALAAIQVLAAVLQPTALAMPVAAALVVVVVAIARHTAIHLVEVLAPLVRALQALKLLHMVAATQVAAVKTAGWARTHGIHTAIEKGQEAFTAAAREDLGTVLRSVMDYKLVVVAASALSGALVAPFPQLAQETCNGFL